jgi:hypothetical protein
MSLTNDPAGHLNEPTTPAHTSPAAPAGDAAATDAVASSSALASAVDHSTSGGPSTGQPRNGNPNLDKVKGAATAFARKLRTEAPKKLQALRDRRAARRR